MRRVALPVAVAALCALTTAHAAPPALVDGTHVRVESGAFAPNWHEGTIGHSSAHCTMVLFKVPLEGSYSKAALSLLDQLQVAEGKAWRDVDLKEILAAEPDECLEDSPD